MISELAKTERGGNILLLICASSLLLQNIIPFCHRDKTILVFIIKHKHSSSITDDLIAWLLASFVRHIDEDEFHLAYRGGDFAILERS